MSKLKAILIAGLLSLSSVSFATSVQYAGAAIATGSEGSISLVNGGHNVTIGGFFGTNVDANTGSVFYDLTIDSGNLSTIAMSFDVSDLSINDVTIAIYEAADVLTGALGSLVDSGTNSLSVALAGGANYFLVLTGVAGDSYNADVSAVPVPAAGLLFASALFGAGALGRRKKKAKASVVGAFARAS